MPSYQTLSTLLIIHSYNYPCDSFFTLKDFMVLITTLGRGINDITGHEQSQIKFESQRICVPCVVSEESRRGVKKLNLLECLAEMPVGIGNLLDPMQWEGCGMGTLREIGVL